MLRPSVVGSTSSILGTVVVFSVVTLIKFRLVSFQFHQREKSVMKVPFLESAFRSQNTAARKLAEKDALASESSSKRWRSTAKGKEEEEEEEEEEVSVIPVSLAAKNLRVAGVKGQAISEEE